jgi:uncharacterized protein (UPF0261 family)
MSPTILLLGTLDTKGAEYAYVRDLIAARGCRTLVVDAGVLGEPAFGRTWARRRSRRPGGSSLAALAGAGRPRRGDGRDGRGRARDGGAAVRGATVRAVLGLGGGGGTTLIAAAMRELPVGVPKLIVSTMASGNTAPYVDVKDITLMYSVVDIAGLNPLSRRILANAAGAICGMASRWCRRRGTGRSSRRRCSA